MESKYIQLDRSFALLPKECSINEDDYDFSRNWGLTTTNKWADLLSLYRVVILSEAGAGKTEELKAITEQLRGEGKKAFFLRLEHLCSDFETSFEAGSIAEFFNWLSSSEEGWFFLDSVDEARLKIINEFEVAIKRFAQKLGENLQRAHVCITSRVSEWRPQQDFSFIADKLPLKEIIRTASEQEKKEGSGQFQSASKSNFTKSEKSIDLSIFVLCPLDDSQILDYSRARGVSEPDKFLEEVKKKEADNYAKRPLDLEKLIIYWKEHSNIGHHKTMLEESISFRLKEWDPKRASKSPLTLEDARYGAEVLAAAVTFQKKNRICIPGADTSVTHQSIDPKDIFADWQNDKINTLLQCPIFDAAIYGTVRFHHRSVREYLTALWLYRLLKSGKSRRAIEALFFAERYGEQVIIPSMRPVLSWFLLMDAGIREKAVTIAPEVLIQGGDPSFFPVAIRESVLKNYCKKYSNDKNGRFSFDLSELRRFSNSDLSIAIKQLIKLYNKNENICQLLLEMVWQGDIKSCADIAFAFASDNSRNEYTRIYAIRALSAIGTAKQKAKLIKSFLKEFTKSHNGSLIGQIFSSFAPPTLSVQEILSLLKCVEIDSEECHLNTSLILSLKEKINNQWKEPELAEFIAGVTKFLKKSPVIEKRNFEVSKQYCWLLPSAILAVERIVIKRDPFALNENSLTILSMAPEERNFIGHFHAEKHSLAGLIPQWPELNHALFWFDVSFMRKQLRKENKNLDDTWPLKIREHYWKFSFDDFKFFIKSIHSKTMKEDQLIALSEAFEIYKCNERFPDWRTELKNAARGKIILEKKLTVLFNPPPMPIEYKRARQSHRNFEKRQIVREQKEKDNRLKWRDWLQRNTVVLRDTSIASEGKVWKATNYLLHEIWSKQNNHNQWARVDWEALIPDFGQEVAEAYRDGCIDYWRKYCPKIQSDNTVDQNSPPVAVIIGLSGLMMESQRTSNWANGLSEDEAKLACRYAVKEINGFPIWLETLYEKFPQAVEERILAEIEWEFTQFKGDAPCHYVLDDVNWQADWIKPKISSTIISFLKKYEPRHDETVKKALEVVLSNGALDKDSLIAIARVKIGTQISNERKAVWIAAWMGIESEAAFNELQVFLKGIADAGSATTAAMVFLTELLGSRRERVNLIYYDYKKPSMLLSLYRLMHIYIKSSDDIHQKGIYSPGLRDDAQDARERLLKFLCEVPGKDAYLELLELANEQPNENIRDWYVNIAHRRAELDAEPRAWESADIKVFANEAEKKPITHQELFNLIVNRLSDLKDDLENGATSQASIFKTVKEESEHRNYIARCLTKRSVGRYIVSQENELADATRPDLYVFGNNIQGEVPIELKVVDNGWTIKDLEKALIDQLCGQYLRDINVTCGVYLLIYRGEKQYWKHPGNQKNLTFDQLIKFIEQKAKKIVRKHPKVESIKVIGIDLTKRTNVVSESNR